MIVEEVCAETGEAGDLVREIEILALEEFIPAFLRTNLFEVGLHLFSIDGLVADRLE